MKSKVAGAFFIMVLLLSATGMMLVNLATADPVPYLPNIIIKSDGTVEPETEFIKQDGNVYTLTNDLVRSYAIKIQCSNIVFDGAGHNINGTTKDYVDSSNAGLRIENVTNVTVKKVQLNGFSGEGITLENCVNCTILRVDAQPFMLWNSSFNTIVECNIVSEYLPLLTRYSNSNTITKNNITIVDLGGEFNVLFENNIGHTISDGVNTFWDNGSVGNYWSDYLTKYPDASEIGNSGIGDTPYVIDADNVDNFPLMALFEVPPEPTPSPEPQPEQETEPFPAALVTGVSGASVAVVGLGLLLYFKRRKHAEVIGKLG